MRKTGAKRSRLMAVRMTASTSAARRRAKGFAALRGASLSAGARRSRKAATRSREGGRGGAWDALIWIERSARSRGATAETKGAPARERSRAAARRSRRRRGAREPRERPPKSRARRRRGPFLVDVLEQLRGRHPVRPDRERRGWRARVRGAGNRVERDAGRRPRRGGVTGAEARRPRGAPSVPTARSAERYAGR